MDWCMGQKESNAIRELVVTHSTNHISVASLPIVTYVFLLTSYLSL